MKKAYELHFNRKNKENLLKIIRSESQSVKSNQTVENLDKFETLRVNGNFLNVENSKIDELLKQISADKIIESEQLLVKQKSDYVSKIIEQVSE